MASLKSEFVLWSGYGSTEEWLCIVEWLWQHGIVALNVLWSGYGSTEEWLCIVEWLWQHWRGTVYCGVVMAALKSDFVLEWLWQHWRVTLNVLRGGYGSTEEWFWLYCGVVMAALNSDFVLWSGYGSTEEWLCIVEWLWQHWTVTLNVLRSGYGNTEQWFWLYCGVVMAARNSDFALKNGFLFNLTSSLLEQNFITSLLSWFT